MKYLLVLIFAFSATAGHACSEKPIRFNWNIQAGDQRVSGDFVRKTVLGKKVRYSTGYENYKADGSYEFVAGSSRYVPSGYVFYDDGTRCINYDTPRYDLYVVKDRKLISINQKGERYVARITK